MTKRTKWHERPAKTQISLGIRPVWSESSLCAQWVAKDPCFLHADSEDSVQTGRIPRLIWVFAGRTVIVLLLSWGVSYQLTYSHYSWAGLNLLSGSPVLSTYAFARNWQLRRYTCYLPITWNPFTIILIIIIISLFQEDNKFDTNASLTYGTQLQR